MLALATVPCSVSAQSGHGVNGTIDTVRYVYRPDSRITVVMHRDMAMWIREKLTHTGQDTAMYLISGDSAWQIIREARVLLPPYRAAMLKRTIASNKQAISMENIFRHPPSP